MPFRKRPSGSGLHHSAQHVARRDRVPDGISRSRRNLALAYAQAAYDRFMREWSHKLLRSSSRGITRLLCCRATFSRFVYCIHAALSRRGRSSARHSNCLPEQPRYAVHRLDTPASVLITLPQEDLVAHMQRSRVYRENRPQPARVYEQHLTTGGRCVAGGKAATAAPAAYRCWPDAAVDDCPYFASWCSIGQGRRP
jgi:hypothetical protein